MKKIGIIAEYNPFHYGHQYQLKQVKKMAEDALLVVAMSGNVVQRGEFALIDKWTRSRLAVESGADLVVELPLLASMQSADYFAHWGVDLLGNLGLDYLVFGTESASDQAIQAAGDWLSQHQASLDQELRQQMEAGKSYAASMQAAIDRLDQDRQVSFNLSQGNHLLGLKYYQWIKANKFPMKILAIPRQEDFLSASQIRHHLFEGTMQAQMLPVSTNQAIKNTYLVDWSAYFDLLKVQIITKTAGQLRQIQSVREGIEYLILEQIDTVGSMTELIQRLTSRRWTRASIQRILMNILLNIQQEEWQAYQDRYLNAPSVRILAYNQRGQQALKEFKRTSNIHLFSNLSQDLYQSYQLMHRADKVYQLASSDILEQNIGRYPYKYSEL